MKRTAAIMGVLFGAIGGAGADVQDVGTTTLGIGLGAFAPKDDRGGLQDQTGQFAVAADATYRYSKHLGFGGDFLGASQRVRTPGSLAPPLFGTLDGRASVDVFGFSATAKGMLSAGAFDAYAGAGLGYFQGRLHVTGTVVGFPGVSEWKHGGTGMLWLAGVSVRIAPEWRLGAEWRRLDFKADFAPTGKVQAGGDVLLLSVRGEIPSH